MRVVHVCGDLGLYGAENVVALLMQHTREPDLELVAMTVNRSKHPEARERVGVPVVAIERDGRKDVTFLFRMVRALRTAAAGRRAHARPPRPLLGAARRACSPASR